MTTGLPGDLQRKEKNRRRQRLQRFADQKLVSGMNCIVGAGIAASAAVHAGIGVDLEMRIALGNCAGGASVDTSAAADACIIDCICHDRLPPYKFVVPL